MKIEPIDAEVRSLIVDVCAETVCKLKITTKSPEDLRRIFISLDGATATFLMMEFLRLTVFEEDLDAIFKGAAARVKKELTESVVQSVYGQSEH